MRRILLLGAGKSSGYLIRFLLDKSVSENLFITVAGLDVNEMLAKTQHHPRTAIEILDVNHKESVSLLVQQCDLVISLLPPHLHLLAAECCLLHQKHFLTASYVSADLKKLHEQAIKNQLIFLNEIGLDPGIDHMSALRLLNRLKKQGAKILGFKSYCGGLIAPESDTNAWHYKFTWNPRNVVLAGQGLPAQFLQDGQIKYVPYAQLFKRTETFSLQSGNFEGYINRDSLAYQKLYGLNKVKTFIRGTLRYQGFCSAWDILVQLGLTDHLLVIEDSEHLTAFDFINRFLIGNATENLIEKIEKTLDKKLSADQIQKINELEFTENTQALGIPQATAAVMLEKILLKHWALAPNDKDLVVMCHEITYQLNQEIKTVQSELQVMGEDQTYTAMAKTVGLPLGIAALLILNKKIKNYGVLLPLDTSIYEPVLSELEKYQIRFMEKEC